MLIMDDVMVEKDESFNVILERTTDLDSRITLIPVNGVMKITDNDGRYNDNMVVHREVSDYVYYDIVVNCTDNFHHRE